MKLRLLVLVLTTLCLCLLLSTQVADKVQQMRHDQALITSVKSGNMQGAVLALEAGADPNTRDEYNEPFSVVESLKKLWRIYAGKRTRPPTALMLAIKVADAEDIAELLIRKGADVNAKADNGETVLTLLFKTWNGYTPEDQKLLKLLANRGVDVNSILDDGSSGLIRAAAADDAEDIVLLLQKGANINFQDNQGMKALMYAVQFGYLECLRLLLAHGADVNAKNKKGQTALAIAKKYAADQAIPLLKKAGAK